MWPLASPLQYPQPSLCSLPEAPRQCCICKRPEVPSASAVSWPVFLFSHFSHYVGSRHVQLRLCHPAGPMVVLVNTAVSHELWGSQWHGLVQSLAPVQEAGKGTKGQAGQSRQSCAHRVSVSRPWHEGDKSSSWNSHMHKEMQFLTYQYNPGLLSVQGSYCSQT